jgi:hypothetical protein
MATHLSMLFDLIGIRSRTIAQQLLSKDFESALIGYSHLVFKIGSRGVHDSLAVGENVKTQVCTPLEAISELLFELCYVDKGQQSSIAMMLAHLIRGS